MIDPVLKKFGFFEARRSIKSLNTTLSHPRTPQTPQKVQNIQQEQLNQTVVKNNVQSGYATIKPFNNSNRSSGRNNLQKLSNYLQSQYKSICPNHSHSQNQVKFICLNQTCSNNFGCAQCFLYKHSNHKKSQISQCIIQLQQLDSFMKQSYNVIISQKAVIKDQFMKQIQLQIDNMCDQFHRSLQFLKNKAFKQIDDHLFSKCQGLQILNIYLNNKSNQLQSEPKLIGQLMKIDIKGIQREMNIHLKQLSYSKLNYQPVIKYFEQMNGALGNFMSEFKKCFPKIYSYSFQSISQIYRQPEKFQSKINGVSQFKSYNEQKNSKTLQTNSLQS